MFGGKKKPPSSEESRNPEVNPIEAAFFEEKSAVMEEVLGEEAGWVYHAIVPFDAGGAVDVYLYPHPEFGGCGFATKELTQSDGTGPIPHETGPYELVAFTQYPMGDPEVEDEPFFEPMVRLRHIMTGLGRYSLQAKLKPYDTCEIPAEEGGANHCLILAPWPEEDVVMEILEKDYSLMLIVEVFPDELDFARQFGTRELIEMLEARGFWPYSDLERRTVIKG